MRLNIRTKNNYSYYTIIKDYTSLNGTRTTTVFEKLGNQQQVEERFGKVNTIENIKKYMNRCSVEKQTFIYLVATELRSVLAAVLLAEKKINAIDEKINSNSIFPVFLWFRIL